MSRAKAIEHLADAETALITYMTRLMETEDDDDQPNSFTMMMAVLRSVSRAAGVLESVDLPAHNNHEPG